MTAQHDPFAERPSPSAPEQAPSDQTQEQSGERSFASDSGPTPDLGSREPGPVPPAHAGSPEPTIAFPPAPPSDHRSPGGPVGGSGGGPVGGSGGGGRRDGRRGGGVAKALGVGTLVVLLAGGAGYGGAALHELGDDDGGSSGTTTSSLDTPASTEKAPAGAVEAVAKELLPSVVQVNVRNDEEGGSGSGVILSADGDILTNNHVVEAAADEGTITVAFSDGTNTSATIVGRDPVTDLAVIRADDKTDLVPAELGASNNLTVGQDVIAIGSPFGLESTVTVGIISALNRPVESSNGAGGDATVFPAVQTDAAINPGNSGGPLVDIEGRVIGINSAIRASATSSGTAGSIGLGFAIPIDLARNVAEQLLAGKPVEHARIGVTVSPAIGEDEITGIGAEVKEVTEGGAGDKAGIEAGDVITSLNGDPIASSSALVATIRGYKPGETVQLTLRRGDETQTVDVTLESDGGELSQE